MTKSVTCPEELGGLASQVTVDYGQLAHQGYLAAATAEPEEVRTIFSFFFFVEDVGGTLHSCMEKKNHYSLHLLAIVLQKCQTKLSA